MDEPIGQVVRQLRKKGILENTLIIFSSDNGGVYSGKYTDNTPLRDGKDSIYEGGVRVCEFATWPGTIPEGIQISEPMHVIDWYPTLLKLAGLALTQELPLDGRDIWPMLTEGAKSPHDALLLVGQDPSVAAIRKGEWKLLVNSDSKHGSDDTKSKASSEAGANIDDMMLELYNLADDVSESHDLVAEYPEKVKELYDRYLEFLRDALPPAKTSDKK